MKVAVQSYSIRDSIGRDLSGVLAQITGMGCRYIEMANFTQDKPFCGQEVGIGLEIGPVELRVILENAGAEMLGVHLLPFPFEAETLRAVLDYHKKMGTKYIVAVPDVIYHSLQEVADMAARLEAAGRQCAQSGLVLLYHNGFQEFLELEGKTVLQHLMEQTSPGLVGLELDVAWAALAGQDPVALMQRYQGRIALVHQKDLARLSGGEMQAVRQRLEQEPAVPFAQLSDCFPQDIFVEVGTGVLDIQRMIEGANRCGCQYFVLEQDYSRIGELESIRVGLEYLKTKEGLDWT